MQLRADLPAEVKGATPGMYARVWLPLPAQAGATGAMARSLIPQSAVLRRAELTAVYVLGAEGRPL
ncbi:MAG: efflux RND transporter periplasmic adaptor subunit, partial [Rhodocyclaceae bacterium]|nr:efflux RND transporter periplasmic adaptor subunit [Rhodocyclaceae bacterium]